MRVAIIGAGGVGGYFGGAIARAGHEVVLLARGAHRDAIRSRGLEVREPEGAWTARVGATDDPAELPPADLAIVAVKSYSLSEVAPAVRKLAEAGAVVLPLLNGVEAFESLAELGVPSERMLAGLTVISVERTAPGVITRKSPFRSVVVGERRGGSSERAERVAALFRAAGADARVSEDIAVDLWRKFLFLTTLAAACGLARAPIGPVRDAPQGGLLLQRAAREIAAVARARRIAISAGEEEQVLERMAALPAGMKPSFLLDLERGGLNELDVLSGAVSRYGKENGVPTPVHDTAVAAFSASVAARQS
jgi:2-dehydropantoate 2-reductase